MEDAGLVDLRVARGAARLVLPRAASDPFAAQRLRERVAAELPAVDAAARRWTRLGADLSPVTCRVLGRMGWVEENLRVVTGVLEPALRRMSSRPPGAGALLGAQLGTLLGLLSTKVLGQYVLPLDRPGTGQLVVVGPNLLDLGDELGPLADDLRRTVLLHEVAHRLQFEAVPWLGDHLRGLVGDYVADTRTDPAALLRAARGLPDAVAEALRGGGVEPLLHVLLTPAQADVMQRAQVLMSVLEGHGNATMGLAGDGLVDDAAAVHEALQQRRVDLAARVLRAVGGLETKRRQYAEGEAWVRGVVERVGVAGLNEVFAAPASLPRPEELHDPGAWVERTAA